VEEQQLPRRDGSIQRRRQVPLEILQRRQLRGQGGDVGRQLLCRQRAAASLIKCCKMVPLRKATNTTLVCFKQLVSGLSGWD
jgi:hypothetical protein